MPLIMFAFPILAFFIYSFYIFVGTKFAKNLFGFLLVFGCVASLVFKVPYFPVSATLLIISLLFGRYYAFYKMHQKRGKLIPIEDIPEGQYHKRMNRRVYPHNEKYKHANF